MYAIIETGGKQYRVQNGDKIAVEKLGVADGETVVFDKVLVVGEGAEAKVGTPYKAKKDYRKKQGHRQPYTLVEITAVDGEKAPAAPVEAKAETAKSEEVKEAADSAAKPAKKPSLKSMRKAELIEFAKDNNIEIDEKATNAVMIETIEAALK